MKKRVVFFLAVGSIVTLAACKKDYNCTCKSGSFAIDAETYEEVTKSDAESKCSDYEEDVQNSGGSGVTCSINEAE